MDYEVTMNGNVKIGEMAPEFTATTTYGEVNLRDYKGKWVVLFSHPGSFTPVCTTEMIAFAQANTYFKGLNTQLLGLSVDSNPSQLAWMYDIYLRTGVKIDFPIVSDRNGEIARKYGMIASDVSNTETVRNVYIIDDKQVIRCILIYPMNIGRFIPEIIRIIKALQMADCSNGLTPANWLDNQPIIKKSPQRLCDIEQEVPKFDGRPNTGSWYLQFKEPDECCKSKVIDTVNYDLPNEKPDS